MASLERIPGKAVADKTLSTYCKGSISDKSYSPFPILTHQANVRFAHATPLRFAGVLRPIKDENLSSDSFSCDEVRFLGHVPRPVDLPGMIDLLDNLNNLYARLRRDSVATQFAPFVIIVRAVQFVRRGAAIAFGNLNSGYLEVVLSLPGCMCPEKEAMNSVRFVRWPRKHM
jgi:hypothetical protein